MPNNPNIPDLSFLDNQSRVGFHIKDVLYTLLRNVHWLVLCGALGTLIANFTARRQERVYESSARIVLRGNAMGGNNSLREATVGNLFSDRPFYNSTVNNEMMILTSKTTMIHTVQNLHLNVSYISMSKVVKRRKDLYGSTPVTVQFLDNSDDDYVAITLTPVDSCNVLMQYGEYDSQTLHLGDTEATPFGRIVANRTWYYTSEAIGEPISVVHAPLHAVAEEYRHAVSVNRDDETNTIVNIRLRDRSPQRASDVINEMIRVYNEEAINDKKRIIAYTYDYINERLAQLHTDLDQQESVLTSFKRDNQLLDLSSYGSSYLSANNRYTEEVEKLKQQLSLVQYLKHINSDKETSSLLPNTLTLDEAGIGPTIERYNELTLQINQNKNAGNPVVQRYVEEQQQMKENLDLMLDIYSVTLQKRIDDAQILIRQTSGNLRQIPDKQVYLESVERLQQIKETLYTNLLTKREELLVSQPSIEGNAKVVDEARINESPVSPNIAHNTVVGLILGLMLPIVIFVLRRSLDTKVRYQNDVKLRTTIPFLCEIPSLKRSDMRDIVVADGHQDSISEAFRLLRFKMDFLGVGEQQSGRVFMITSLLPSSGKTFLSSNVSACFAIAGKRTLLIDLDLRKGSLTHRFSSRRKKGLTDYLLGRCDNLDEIIQHQVVSAGLDTIFSGMIPPNPAELLESGRIENLFNELRHRYDYIIVDSAPMTVVDNNELKQWVDCTVFVVRSGKYDKRILNEMEELYQSRSFIGMAVVLNDVAYPKRSPIDRVFGLDYGYGYGYGHRYGYGYGYQDYAYSDPDSESHTG